MSNTDKILVVISGGTIDAEPYEFTPENITPLEHSIIPASLELLGLADQCVCYSWLRKDSKLFRYEELAALAAILKAQDYHYVVITHGTDYMPRNARALSRVLAAEGSTATVVFTGAMVPIMNELAGYGKTDGYDNLRFAIGRARTLEPGVYIGFANTIFNPDYTVKDRPNKRFVTVAELPPPEISRAMDSEFQMISDLAWRIWTVSYKGVLADEHIENLLQKIYDPAALKEQADKGEIFWIAREDGLEVGYASGYVKEDVLWLKKLYVVPTLQGRGVGRALMNHVAKELGPARCMNLYVNRGNVAAQAFYEKIGFKVSHEEEVQMGDHRFLDYVLTKPL